MRFKIAIAGQHLALTMKALLLALACGACVRYSITETLQTIQIKTGEPYALAGSSLTLVETAPSVNRALLRIASPGQPPEQSWVRTGDYATFSPATGSRGVRLIDVGASSATLELRGARHSGN